MAPESENNKGFIPPDLLIGATTEILAANTALDKDKFTVVIPGLKTGTSYAFQFQYVFEDGEESDWSPGVSVTTASPTALNAPQFLEADLSSNGSTLIIKWSGVDYLGNAYGTNLAGVEVFIRGGTYGSTSISANRLFTKQGVELLTVDVGANYHVKLRAVSKAGGVSAFSTERMASPVAPLVVDLTPPTNPTGISATAEVDPNDNTGFSLKSTFSFTKSSDTTCRGYRIRWTTETSNPVYEYAFVEHPASGSTVSYTATGLIPNVTYYYQVAAVDEFNNTQSYSTAGTFVAQDSVATAEGSLARLKSYISIGGATGDQFKFGTGIATSINTSTTITPSLSSGTYHGIILNKTGNKNNYFLTNGYFRVGTDTQFMYFNGNDLYVTGNIDIKGGSKFGGHVQLSTTGASIFNGTIANDILTTDGWILNNTGLQFKKTINGNLTDMITLSSSTGTLTALSANITGTITGSNIFGSTIATAESSTARRAILNPSTHALSFFATGGVGQAHVSPFDDANNPGFIISAGSSPLSTIGSSSDPAMLMYKNSSSGNYITILPGSSQGTTGVGIYMSTGTSPSLSGGTFVSTSGAGFGRLRNISTVTTTNWGSSGSSYQNSGEEGEVLLVYVP